MSSLNKAVLDLDTGDLTRLNNQSKFSNSEIKEVFNSDSREEKLEFLEEVAGSSASVIAPTQGVAYDADLEGAKQINLISEGELNTDAELMVVPKGDIEEGSDYWVVIISDTFMKYFKEVGKDIWETVKERNMEYDGSIPSRTGFEYSYDFRESYALSNNDGNTVIFPIPGDLESRDYLAVDFEYLESAVRVSREGGGYRGSWFKDKTVEWKTEQPIAMIEVDDGFIMIDYASSFEREEHTNDKMRLGDYVRKKANDDGELTLVTALPTDSYPDEQSLVQEAKSSELEVTENDLLERLESEIEGYGSGYNEGIDLSVKIDESVTEKLLDLDPEPVKITDEMVMSVRGENPDIELVTVLFGDDQRAFTASNLEEYGAFEEGDVAEIPLVDKTNLSRSKSVEQILDRLEKRTNGYDWKQSRDGEFVFETEGDNFSVKIIFDPSQKKDYVVPEEYIENYPEFEEKAEKFGISLSTGDYKDGRGIFFDAWHISDFMKEYRQFKQDGMEQSAKDYVRNVLSGGKELTDEELIEKVSSTMDVSEEEVEEAIEDLYDMNEISLNKSGEYGLALSDVESDDLENNLVRDEMLSEAEDVDIENWSGQDKDKAIVVMDDAEAVALWKRDDGEQDVKITTATRPVSGNVKDGREQIYTTIIDKDLPGDISRRNYKSFSSALRRAKNYMKENKEIDSKAEMSDSSVKYSSSVSSNQNTLMDISSKEKISSLSDAESFFMDLDIEDDSQESFVVGYLGSDNSLLGYEELGSGDNDSVNFDHRDVIEGAKDKGSSRVLVAHNHPSGNPEPSEDDIVATRSLKYDLREEDIELVDHLVLTENGVSSMKSESGLL